MKSEKLKTVNGGVADWIIGIKSSKHQGEFLKRFRASKEGKDGSVFRYHILKRRQ